jgi:hypothetical protein
LNVEEIEKILLEKGEERGSVCLPHHSYKKRDQSMGSSRRREFDRVDFIL